MEFLKSLFSKSSILVCIILVVALIIRLIAIRNYPAVPISDDSQYLQLGKSLASLHRYVNSDGSAALLRPPGYPFLISIVFQFLPATETSMYLFQAGLGSLFCVLIFVLSKSLFDLKKAFAAGILAAIYPSFYWLSRILLTENLALPLMALTLLLTVRYLSRPSLWLGIALGFFFGLGNLVRGGSFLYSILTLIFLWIGLKKKSSINLATRAVFIPLIMMSVTQAPWAIRNYNSFHEWVMVSSNDGVTLYTSYWPKIVQGKTMWGIVYLPPEIEALDQRLHFSEIEVSRLLKNYTLVHLKAEPFRFFKYLPQKMLFLFIPRDYETFPHENASYAVNWFYLLIAIPGFLGYLLYFQSNRANALVLSALPLSVLIQTILFYGCPRYRVPMEILLVIFTPLGLLAIIGKLRRRSTWGDLAHAPNSNS